ncbi:RAxF-45 family protein [Paenibacillus dendritiformis]|uniref:RAxF-45 family protein n=2 Tax=Paenibacillus TaxID=44249 RepID=UPI00387E18FA
MRLGGTRRTWRWVSGRRYFTASSLSGIIWNNYALIAEHEQEVRQEMNRSVATIRISQLPMALFGITHAGVVNGIGVSIFANTNVTNWREDSPALT